MPPGVTAEAQRFVSQVVTAIKTFPTAFIGKSFEEKTQFLIDAGYIEELPSKEIRHEAYLHFQRTRERDRQKREGA